MLKKWVIDKIEKGCDIGIHDENNKKNIITYWTVLYFS